jgi:hypothetical protein
MPDVGLDFEDLTRVSGGVAPQIFPVVGNTPVVSSSSSSSSSSSKQNSKLLSKSVNYILLTEET